MLNRLKARSIFLVAAQRRTTVLLARGDLELVYHHNHTVELVAPDGFRKPLTPISTVAYADREGFLKIDLRGHK